MRGVKKRCKQRSFIIFKCLRFTPLSSLCRKRKICVSKSNINEENEERMLKGHFSFVFIEEESSKECIIQKIDPKKHFIFDAKVSGKEKKRKMEDGP